MLTMSLSSLQLDITHIRVNKLETDLKTSRTNSTSNWRAKTLLERLERQKWWSGVAHRREKSCEPGGRKAPGSLHGDNKSP